MLRVFRGSVGLASFSRRAFALTHASPLPLLAMTLMLCACDPGGANDIATVAAEPGSALAASVETWRLADTPMFTIGEPDGPTAIGSLMATLPGAGALFDNGSIAFVDFAGTEVAIHDSTGSRIAAVGRRGSGPGEFGVIGGVGVFASGDSLIVWEFTAGLPMPGLRFSVFGSDGTYARTVRADPGRHVILGHFDDGSLFASMSLPGSGIPASDGDFARDPIFMGRFSAAGEDLGRFGPFLGNEYRISEGGARSNVIAGRGTVFGVGRERFYAGDNGRFEITAYDRDTGHPVRQFAREIEFVVVPDSAVASERAADADRRQQLASQQRASLPALGERPARETYSAFTRIIEAPNETVWVAHSSDPGSELNIWSVFNGEGELIAEAHIPRDLTILSTGSDRVFVASADELDVDYVHVFEIVR